MNQCPRCLKKTDDVHTCTPTKEWREMEIKLSIANAAIAMQNEALKYAIDDLTIRAKLAEDDSLNIGQGALDKMHEALSTSPESVAAWEAEKLLPLQRQVAMLVRALQTAKHGITMWEIKQAATDALTNTQAAAEAFMNEHAASVMEKAANEIERTKLYPGGREECEVYENVWSAAIGLRTKAAELRAANKKEN